MNLKTLKEIRKLRKISIKELSRLTGVSRDRISLIERDKVNPSFGTVKTICAALNCNIVITL
jgi:transcriptional regulator with XRE-family HTH domain